jgi:hypothetical protein
MAEEKAYVGYRSAGRRPEGRQDRRAAADAPLSALRGAVSGVLGAPGDIESLIRMLPGLSERTVLPTSEDVEKRLPLPELNRTPTGRAFTTAGQLGGGFYGGPGSPLRAVAALPSAVSRAGRDFLMSSSPVNVIKPKGGNWLAGSVERAVEPMRQTVLNETGLQNLAERAGVDVSESVRARQLPEAAMNRWLDSKLSKYIRNEMGTPEDPIRALAERGVTHAEHGLQYMRPDDIENLASVRQAQGFEPGGMGQSELARRWEDLADVAIDEPELAGHLMRLTDRSPTVQENPWLAKVPPETPVHSLQNPGSARYDLGFGHLTDELRNVINPESGLPANLQWKYADLDKVTVPQAVQRVHDINEWRAAQKAEADLVRARNPATFTHKEYPEQGMSWVELRAPEADVSDIRFEKAAEGVRAFDAEGNRLVSPGGYNVFANEEQALMQLRGERASKPLADALKYEGETMGHCVGGYCPDVLEGRSKIYSLRDKKGQPHVTIEVEPIRGSELGRMMGDLSDEEAALMYKNPPQRIVQIKGKGNKAPKAEYLPAVQDFVRSGQWSDVGDLSNTGLRDVSGWRGKVTDYGADPAKVEEFFSRLPNRYASQSELDELMGPLGGDYTFSRLARHINGEQLDTPKPAPDAEGFASGGLVEYNPAKIQSLVDTLREEMYG